MFNQPRLFIVILSTIMFTCLQSEQYIAFSTYSIDQSSKNDFHHTQSHHDFSYNNSQHSYDFNKSIGNKHQFENYKAQDFIEKPPSNNNNLSYISAEDLHQRINQHALAQFHDHITEYKKLETTYQNHTPSVSNATAKRLHAYNSMSSSDQRAYTSQSYLLNNNIKQLLHKHGHTTHQFDRCSGNALDHVIHQESLDILERVDTLPINSILYDHQDALVDFTVAMAAYSHEGLTHKATQIADMCWTLLDFGQAVIEGAAIGVYSAAADIITNPIEATLCIVAGKELLAYQLCKVLYNVADISVTAINDYDHAKEKWHNYTQPITNIINAISNKELSLRDSVKGGTTLVVGMYAQGKLLGGLGKFCSTIKQKAMCFIEKNPLLRPQEYLATPEGLLLKAINEAKTTTASNLKSSLASNKETFSNLTDNLKSIILKDQQHIFSKKHIKANILSLGKNQEEIMNSLYDIIVSINKKGLLKDGPNQIKATINNINNVEIKCFIKDGKAISVDAYISDFNRIYNNFIDISKV